MVLSTKNRDRTSISTLRQMLPEDLLRYCQTNRLVDTVLSRGEPPAGSGTPGTAAAPAAVANSSTTREGRGGRSDHYSGSHHRNYY